MIMFFVKYFNYYNIGLVRGVYYPYEMFFNNSKIILMFFIELILIIIHPNIFIINKKFE